MIATEKKSIPSKRRHYISTLTAYNIGTNRILFTHELAFFKMSITSELPFTFT